MRRQWLHDAAKFGAGLAVADFVVLWWFSMQKTVPSLFLGLPLAKTMLTQGMIIDIFIIILLVHYGWNIGTIPQIKERMYLTVAGCIFALIAGAHLLRVLYSGDLVIFGWDVPIFLSWLGIAVSAYLAYASFHLAGRMKR